MDVAGLLTECRTRAGLTQAALAGRAGTSQATLSAYEAGRKEPGAATLARILAAAGMRLAAVPAEGAVRVPSPGDLADRGRVFEEVLELAEALPVRHAPSLGFPALARTGA